MTPLTALWLPIIVSAVIVFVVSFIIHALIPWHRNDFAPLADEARFAEAVRPLAIPPGDYLVPRATSMAEMKSAEFQERRKRGPIMMLTVMRHEDTGMAGPLVLWFLYSVVISIFAGYISGRALAPGTHYLEVFRFAGATSFIGYSLALWQMWIWYHRKLSTTIKSTIDGLLYGLLTAGVFGWLWPR